MATSDEQPPAFCGAPAATNRRAAVLDLTRWPITFFGDECYPVWDLSEEVFLGSKKVGEAEFAWVSIKYAQSNYRQLKQYYERERLDAFDLLDYEIARPGKEIVENFKDMHMSDILLIHQGEVVGVYHSRGIAIDPEHRGKGLSTILILAKVTALGKPANPDRPYSAAGEGAMRKAWSWAREVRNRFL